MPLHPEYLPIDDAIRRSKYAEIDRDLGIPPKATSIFGRGCFLQEVLRRTGFIEYCREYRGVSDVRILAEVGNEYAPDEVAAPSLGVGHSSNSSCQFRVYDQHKPLLDHNECADGPKNLLEFFQSSPLVGADLDLERLDDACGATVPRRRGLGIDQGKIWIADDFDAPDDDITELFEDP